MPKLNPKNLNPASIVTYVLDAKARKQFNERAYYERNKEDRLAKVRAYYKKNHPKKAKATYEKKPKKVKLTEEERKLYKYNYNKKYNAKKKLEIPPCGCGSTAISRIRHLNSTKHLDWVAANDPICQLE